MKSITLKILIALLLIVNCQLSIVNYAQIGINSDGSNPNASAMLDVVSTDKGVLIPRMDSTSRLNISNPADGLILYDSTTTSFWYYDETEWHEIYRKSDGLPLENLVNEIILEPELFCPEIVDDISVGQVYHIEIRENYLYIVLLNSNELKIFDIREPSSPKLLSTTSVSNNPYFVEIVGDYAYLVNHDGANIEIIDISDAYNPILKGTLSIPYTRLMCIRVKGNYAYVVDNSFFNNDSLRVVDISDPNNPSLVTSIDAGLGINCLVILDDYIYTSSKDNLNFNTIDISNPTAPTIVNTISVARSHFLHLDKDSSLIYSVGYYSNELSIIDVSTPTLPVLVSPSLNIGDGYVGVFVKDGYAYTTSYTFNNLKIIDVSSSTNPTLVESVTLNATLPNMVVVSDQQYAYVGMVGSENLLTIDLACDKILGYHSSTNEIISFSLDNLDNQELSLSTNTLSLSGGSNTIDLSGYLDNTDNQELSLSTNTLALSGGSNTINLSGYLDNTDAQTLSFSGNTLAISGSNSTIDLSSLSDDLGNHTATQNIQINGNWLSNDGDNEGIYVTNSGNVGIGVNTPTNGLLEVGSFTSSALTNNGSYSYLNCCANSNSILVTNNTIDKDISIYALGRIVGNFVISHSDERIKNIQGISNNKTDLNTLKQIQITDYQFKDQIKNGNISQKKVIAQQVAKVYPQAVFKNTTEVIPNIFKTATIDKNGWIDFNEQWTMDKEQLKKGDKVKIIFEQGEKLLEVLETNENTFRVETLHCNVSTGSKIFVYGTQVDDFHTVDYEAISMLNVSATQQLAKEVEQLKNENEVLKISNAGLKTQINKISVLEQQNTQMKAVLEQIQEQLNNQRNNTNAVK